MRAFYGKHPPPAARADHPASSGHRKITRADGLFAIALTGRAVWMGYDRRHARGLHTRRAVTARTRRGGPVPLPGRLEPRGPEPGRYGYAILGAGCAGLS